MKKQPYYKFIITGFIFLYLIAMTLSTYFATKRFEQMHENNIETVISDMKTSFQYLDTYNLPTIGDTEKHMTNLLTALVSQSKVFQPTENNYQQISVGLYPHGGDGKLLAQTESFFQYLNFSADKPTIHQILLTDCLSEKEIDDLADYYATTYDPSISWIFAFDTPKEQFPLYGIEISAYTCDPESGKMTTHGDKWTWETSENIKKEASSIIYSYDLSPDKDWIMPYLTAGKRQYDKWKNDSFLQNFEDAISPDSTPDSTLFTKREERMNIDIKYGYVFKIRSTSQPILAAMDYLKYVYICCLLIVIACIAAVIYSTNKSYKQRAAIEETRRDFTNAIAHELKTPLGVIRGFSENLQENTETDKRDYYLAQIISQTENIDDMVQEMIYISKFDSEHLDLKKETLSMRTIIEEQIAKLEPVASNKNLEISYKVQEDFTVDADKHYMEKAIWNLLSNAIEYNRPDGMIMIYLSSQMCSIENTGTQIAEEDLPHIFDMFYSGDKSRNSKEKHLGLGLYLAKRILGLHQLNLTLENTIDGVKVTIMR